MIDLKQVDPAFEILEESAEFQPLHYRIHNRVARRGVALHSYAVKFFRDGPRGLSPGVDDLDLNADALKRLGERMSLEFAAACTRGVGAELENMKGAI